MRDFKQGGGKRFGGGHGGGFGRRDGDRPNFPRKSWGGSGGRDRGPVTMHQAVCAQCGKPCEVPFKPMGGKPVYCSQCFSNRGEGQISNKFERRDSERPRFEDKRMFDAICDKCGKRFELPFRPTGDKPVYCNECFDKGGDSLNKNNGKAVNQYKEQFDMLNDKLDRIIKALTPVVPVKEEKKEVIVEKKKAVVEKKEKAKKSKKV